MKSSALTGGGGAPPPHSPDVETKTNSPYSDEDIARARITLQEVVQKDQPISSNVAALIHQIGSSMMPGMYQFALPDVEIDDKGTTLGTAIGDQLNNTFTQASLANWLAIHAKNQVTACRIAFCLYPHYAPSTRATSFTQTMRTLLLLSPSQLAKTTSSTELLTMWNRLVRDVSDRPSEVTGTLNAKADLSVQIKHMMQWTTDNLEAFSSPRAPVGEEKNGNEAEEPPVSLPFPSLPHIRTGEPLFIPDAKVLQLRAKCTSTEETSYVSRVLALAKLIFGEVTGRNPLTPEDPVLTYQRDEATSHSVEEPFLDGIGRHIWEILFPTLPIESQNLPLVRKVTDRMLRTFPTSSAVKQAASKLVYEVVPQFLQSQRSVFSTQYADPEMARSTALHKAIKLVDWVDTLEEEVPEAFRDHEQFAAMKRQIVEKIFPIAIGYLTPPDLSEDTQRPVDAGIYSEWREHHSLGDEDDTEARITDAKGFLRYRAVYALNALFDNVPPKSANCLGQAGPQQEAFKQELVARLMRLSEADRSAFSQRIIPYAVVGPTFLQIATEEVDRENRLTREELMQRIQDSTPQQLLESAATAKMSEIFQNLRDEHHQPHEI